jgi:hypothetical protein
MRRFRLDGLTTVKPFRSVWVTGVEEDIPPRRGATPRETSFGEPFRRHSDSRFREECHACLCSSRERIEIVVFRQQVSDGRRF